MIYLFFGKDKFGINKSLSELQKKEAEVTLYETIQSEELCSHLATQSFFGTRKFHVVKNFLSGLDDKKISLLINSLSNLSDLTDIAFIEDGRPKSSKLMAFFSKNADVKNYDEPTVPDLVSFIKKQVAEEGGEIAPLAAERLASFVGPDKWQLSEEIKKLVLYKKGDNEIEAIETADVDKLVKASFEANIFLLMDAFAAKNSKRSVELLNEFLDSGENEIYLLTMIEKQFKNIAMAKFEDKISETSLARKAGIHPYVAKKSIAQARNFEKTEILEMYKRLMDADLKLKSGFEPKQVLLRLTTEK